MLSGAHRMIRCGAERVRLEISTWDRFDQSLLVAPWPLGLVAVNARGDLSGEMSETGRQVASRSGSSLRGGGRDVVVVRAAMRRARQPRPSDQEEQRGDEGNEEFEVVNLVPNNGIWMEVSEI
jgi:hypothetical protein